MFFFFILNQKRIKIPFLRYKTNNFKEEIDEITANISSENNDKKQEQK